MKKLILITAVMVLGSGYAMAGDNRTVPSSRVSNPVISADYGGVDISTNLFSSGQTFLGAGEFIVYGVVASSGPGGAFCSFADTASALGTPPESFRVYNSTTATASAITGGVYTLPYPARFKNGLSFKWSDATFNSVGVLYWKVR